MGNSQRQPISFGSERSISFGFGLGLVSAIAALWRIGYLLATRARPPSADGFAYLIVGRNVVEGRGFTTFTGAETALHPPLWSIVLGLASRAGLDTLFQQQVAAALIGVAAVALVGLAGRAVAGHRVGLIAAAIAACSPHLWVWERELAAEVLVVPLSALAVLLAYRWLEAQQTRVMAALGGVVGLLVLTRSEQLLLLGVLVVGVIWIGPRPALGRVVPAAVAGLLCAVVVAPWVIYNQDRFENRAFLATGSGVTLAYANNPTTYQGPRLGHGDGDTWNQMLLVGGDESESDSVFRERGLEYVADNKGRLPAVLAARHGRTWGLFRPGQQATFDQNWGNSPRWVFRTGFVYDWALVPFAAIGVVALRRRRVPLLPVAALFVVAVVNVTVTYGQTRYRVPAEVSLIVLAAVGIGALVDRWTGAYSSEPERSTTPSLAGAGQPSQSVISRRHRE